MHLFTAIYTDLWPLDSCAFVYCNLYCTLTSDLLPLDSCALILFTAIYTAHWPLTSATQPDTIGICIVESEGQQETCTWPPSCSVQLGALRHILLVELSAHEHTVFARKIPSLFLSGKKYLFKCTLISFLSHFCHLTPIFITSDREHYNLSCTTKWLRGDRSTYSWRRCFLPVVVFSSIHTYRCSQSKRGLHSVCFPSQRLDNGFEVPDCN